MNFNFGAPLRKFFAHLNSLKCKKGFTLAELLVSVLIISIIMVVLAPVMTRKHSNRVNINGAGGGTVTQASKLFLYNLTDPDCTPVTGQNALDCNFTTGSGVKSVNVVMVSGGGGGAGGTPPTTEYGKKLTVTNSAIGSAKTQEITITKNMKNVVVSYLSGSGGGGGGGAWVEESSGPKSQADCVLYNAIYKAGNGNTVKNLCWTNRNAGELVYHLANVKKLSTRGIPGQGIESAYCDSNNDLCCWYGTTSAPCSNNGLYRTYDACSRTVCNWSASNEICNQYKVGDTKAGDWRLPTKEEIEVLYSDRNTIAKLEFCSGSQGSYPLSSCLAYYLNDQDYFKGGCVAEYRYWGFDAGYYASGTCTPYRLWTSTESNKKYYTLEIRSSVSYPRDYPSNVNSARCVYEGRISNISLSGGGGSAGGYFKNYQIPESVISNNIGGKIVLYSAPWAKGGNKASSKGANAGDGDNGTVSYIAIYNKSGQQVWGLEASGGNGGKGATGSNYGNGGSSVATNSCKIFQNGSWTNTSCSGVGGAGNNGNKLQVTDSNTAAGGGVGGGSMYNTTTLSAGGNGGSSSFVNGHNGVRCGSGGGGGTTKVVDSVATAGAGGKGATGVAEITYDIVYDPAAGGGGGGGGAMLKVENITVTPSTNYVIRVGGGGNGGAVSNNGSDGGESKVTFGSVSYSLSGGKGGTAGTSATDTTSVVHGVGGAGANKLSTGTSVAGTKGSDGSAGDIGAIGGNGGKSGVESEGGCGALFDNGGSCSATGAYGLSPMFISPSNIFDAAANYGSAGAGGGGGGYAYNTTMYPTNNPGYGGNGQNGYVYLYWTEYN